VPNDYQGVDGGPVNRARHRGLILAVTLTGLLSSNILFTVFAVALPQVAKGLLGSSSPRALATITWVVTAPLLAVAVASPLAGKLSDRMGHRRVYLVGMGSNFSVAVLSALSPDAGSLIAARALGGLVGAGLGASSMAIVLGMYEPHERVKAMGWWSLVGAGGPVLGVAVGGVLIHAIGWRSLFLLEGLVALVALALAAKLLPSHGQGQRLVDSRAVPLDVLGAIVVTGTVGSALFALNRGPVLGWSSPVVAAAYVVCVLGAVATVAVESRAVDPIVPLHYLRRRNFLFPVTALVCSNSAYMGGFLLSPLLIEQVYGHGEAAAGLLVVPRPLTFSLIAPIAGYAAAKLGERTLAVFGAICVAASMVTYTLTTDRSLVLVELALVLSGAGMGVAAPAIGASVANVVDQDALGVASAAQQLLLQLSTVAGIQVLETVQAASAHGQSSALLHSFHVAFVVGATVAVLAVPCAAMLRSTDHGVILPAS
jgi:MFS family permease